jgi:hypothetical protein
MTKHSRRHPQVSQLLVCRPWSSTVYGPVPFSGPLFGWAAEALQSQGGVKHDGALTGSADSYAVRTG